MSILDFIVSVALWPFILFIELADKFDKTYIGRKHDTYNRD